MPLVSREGGGPGQPGTVSAPMLNEREVVIGWSGGSTEVDRSPGSNLVHEAKLYIV